MAKIVGVSFSNNEMFNISNEYGMLALEMVEKTSFYQVRDINLVNDIQNIINENPKIVIFFVSFHCYESLKESCEIIKASLSECVVIACGQVATKLSELLLRNIPLIDIVVLGEFEDTLIDVANKIIRDEVYKECRGISYVENNKYIITTTRKLLDIEKIPYLLRKDVTNNLRFFHMIGSRGCEGNCTFCDKNYIYKLGDELKPRFRSVENIVKEIDMLVEKGNCKFVSFSDSTFCSNENIIDRLNELYFLLKEKRYWVQFMFCLRCEQITEQVALTLGKLTEVGLGKVFLGVESFNEEDLKLYGKKSDVATNMRAIQQLKNIKTSNNYFLRVAYGFINFNPYSTLNGLENNRKYLKKLSLDINPYIVSTKVSLNAISPLTQKVNADNLFLKRIEDYSIKELMDRRYQYRFRDEKVQNVFEILLLCVSNIDFKNINGVEFIRNRYLHFYGYDRVVENIDFAYNIWIETVSELTDRLFDFSISTGTLEEKRTRVQKECDMFNKRFREVDNKLMNAQKKAMIYLERIDELIYNRLR